MISFTIITCTWQAEAVLQRTLDSVSAQVYPRVQHLLIDGASTDGTLSMARDYMARDRQVNNGHEVELVSEKDKGLYDAMNKGAAMATGDYVCYLNAGDTLPASDTLRRIAETVGESDTLPAVLYGETDIVDADGRFVRHRRLRVPEKLTWKSFRKGMLVCHQSFYARTDLARQIPYNLDYRYSADVDWCIRVMKAAERMDLPLVNLHFVTACFLEGGMTKVNHRASLKERFRIMTKHYGWPVTAAMHVWFALRALWKK